jgi:hypothetical protein
MPGTATHLRLPPYWGSNLGGSVTGSLSASGNPSANPLCERDDHLRLRQNASCPFASYAASPTTPLLNRRRGISDCEAAVAGRAFPAWRVYVRRVAVGLPWLIAVCAACGPGLGQVARGVGAGDSSCLVVVHAEACCRLGAGRAVPWDWDNGVVGGKPSLAGIFRAGGRRFAVPN